MVRGLCCRVFCEGAVGGMKRLEAQRGGGDAPRDDGKAQTTREGGLVPDASHDRL
jgi:hypothetical protein